LSRYKENREKLLTVNVFHDLQRQILEVPSLLRVMNNYYNKKAEVQKKMKPFIIRKFEEGLKTLRADKNWLFNLSNFTLSEEILPSKDSFRFPDSIVLFEAWMNLGLKALFPRIVVHFKFPGLLKREKTRNVFQFIYATSRGFGFPINFGPEFYGYKPLFLKILDPFLKWIHTLSRKANQLIYMIGDKKLKAKRHHPGEFESVIISEYENNIYKGIDTLLHGYFTNEPKFLGRFNSLEESLQNLMFSYTVGDHAMSVEKFISSRTLKVPIIMYDELVQKYEVDFYAYIKKLMNVVKVINKKINLYKKKRKFLINKLNFIDLIKYRVESSKIEKIPGFKISEKFSEIEKYRYYKELLEKIRELLWTTPLYMHTIHDPKKNIKELKFLKQKVDDIDDFEQESRESILLSFIKYYERTKNFVFEEKEIIEQLKKLRDFMAKMWLYFKERQFKYAIKKLNDIATLSLEEKNYKEKVDEYLDKLIPIISIYEIFHRPLSESVYPESISQTQRIGAHLARFITSKYNPIGFNIMKLFNRMAFYNWSYFIKKNNLSFKRYFNFFLKLPIWKYIPAKIKERILN